MKKEISLNIKFIEILVSGVDNSREESCSMSIQRAIYLSVRIAPISSTLP
jgi:hypothetical protein